MNIFRLYNQNKVAVWTVIIIIVFFIFIIQVINNLLVDQHKSENENNNVVINEKLYQNKIAIEETITEEQVKEDVELIIDQFIKYCNLSNAQEAYNLLTEECKQQAFPNIETFEKNYLKINFDTQKLYKKERYKGNTYKITLYENMLNTGNTNKESKQDYYTIQKKNGEIKLNISSYVERSEIGKKNKNNYFEVEVVKKDTYIEYETYELKITNLSENTIMLDTKQKTKTMYLLDENNTKYYAAGHEILDTNLVIKPSYTNTLLIKYTKEYKSNTSKKLVFEDIILNYDYQKNKTEQEKSKIEINV